MPFHPILRDRSIDDWIARYEESQNPVNRVFHSVGIPMIALSIPLLLIAPFMRSCGDSGRLPWGCSFSTGSSSSLDMLSKAGRLSFSKTGVFYWLACAGG